MFHFRSRNYRPNSFRRLRRRAVHKNGDCNVIQKNLAKRRLRFLQDIFTTLVDSQWRWTLLAFALSFILSWLFFAVIWWLIAFTHGDLEPPHLPDFQGKSLFCVNVTSLSFITCCSTSNLIRMTSLISSVERSWRRMYHMKRSSFM